MLLSVSFGVSIPIGLTPLDAQAHNHNVLGSQKSVAPFMRRTGNRI